MDIEVRRSNRKTIALEVTTQAKVIVRAPLWMPESEIQKLVNDKSSWIEKNVRKIQEQKSINNSFDKLSKNELRVLAKHARAVIIPKVEYYAQRIGVSYGRVAIRSQKTRWGSCSAKGNLNFNCLLMFAPERVLDYVIIHELCHRKQMNHSMKFWLEVENMMPDYKKQKKWLKDNGAGLIARLGE